MIRGVGGRGTPYNGLYAEAPPERGTFFRLQVYKRVGISRVEVYKRVGKSFVQVFKRVFNQTISNRRTLCAVFIKHNMKMTTRPPFSAIYSYHGLTRACMKGLPFFNKSYIKGLPFLAKWYIKGYGSDKKRSLPVLNFVKYPRDYDLLVNF